MRIIRFLAMILVVTSLFVTSLVPAFAIITQGSESSSSAHGFGGTLRYGTFSDPICLVPFMNADSASSDVTALMFNGLLNYNEKLDVVSNVAESYTMSKDGLTITFKLKKGVLWHDGKELTAADVKYSYELIIDPAVNSPRRSDFEKIKSIEAPDNYTVIFKMKEIDGVILERFTTGYIVPKHVYEKLDKTALKTSAQARAPIGNGPFKFAEWKSQERVVLERFDQYFDGKPGFDKYIFDINPSQATAMVKAQKGEVERVFVPESDVARMSKISTLNVNRYVGNVFDCVVWNTKTTFFSDKKVRQAMTYAINKQAIVSGIYKGNGKVAAGSFVPALPFYNKNANTFKYDLAKAKKLLEEAGWKVGKDGIRVKDGKKFEIIMITNKGNIMREKMLVYVQTALKQVGVKVEPRILEWNTFITKYVEQGKFDGYVGGFTTGLTADHRPFYHSDKTQGYLNRGRYSNPEVDKLLEAVVATADRTKQAELAKQIQVLVAEDQPYTFIIYRTQAYAYSKSVKNVKSYDLLGWFNPEKCYIK
jgi:peptide/nickel transport system substrate-binding protein